MSAIRTTAPKWAPNAIASPKGWLHPYTHELLIAIRLVTGNPNLEKAKNVKKSNAKVPKTNIN